MTLEIGEFLRLAISGPPPDTVAKNPPATRPKRTTKIKIKGRVFANPRRR